MRAGRLDPGGPAGRRGGQLAEVGGAVVPLRTRAGCSRPRWWPAGRCGASVSSLVQTYGTVPYADVDPTWLAWTATC